MKKKLSLILCFVLLLAVSVQTVTVMAASAPTISCANVTCETGEQITVEVTVSNNPGFTYLEMTPAYSSELTLVKVANGNLVSDFTKGKQYVWTADEDVTEDGVLMVFTFRVEETVAAGEYSVGFVVRTCGNFNEEAVQFSVESSTITVKTKQIPVTGVSLNKDVLSLKMGESEILTANISPENATNKTLIWKSSNSSVARVDAAGKVTALKEGSTAITVTTEDGSFSASCAVYVECGHTNKTETPAQNPDCVHAGNNKYYTCGDCGDVFKADGITETTAEAETIPALQHDFTEKIEDAAHLVPGSGADCQHIKKYYYDCSRCDAIGTKVWSSTAVGSHRIETAWTTQDGKHYHKCLVDGCTYTASKANCSGGAADCLNRAVCNVCKQPYGALADCDFSAEKTDSKYLKSAATCTDVAVYYKSCAVCGKTSMEIFAYGEVDGNNHAGGMELCNTVEASCTADGYTGDTYCKGCETKLETGAVIPGGHELTLIEQIPATHEAAGNITYYFCSVCSKLYGDEQAATELTAEEVIIPKGEHNYGEDYCTDANNHWKECECGSKIEEGAHTYGEWETVVAANVGVEGRRERICTTCGYKQTEKIPDTSSPATEDHFVPLLWGALTVVSVCGVIMALIAGRKRKASF